MGQMERWSLRGTQGAGASPLGKFKHMRPAQRWPGRKDEAVGAGVLIKPSHSYVQKKDYLFFWHLRNHSPGQRSEKRHNPYDNSQSARNLNDKYTQNLYLNPPKSSLGKRASSSDALKQNYAILRWLLAKCRVFPFVELFQKLIETI